MEEEEDAEEVAGFDWDPGLPTYRARNLLVKEMRKTNVIQAKAALLASAITLTHPMTAGSTSISKSEPMGASPPEVY